MTLPCCFKTGLSLSHDVKHKRSTWAQSCRAGVTCLLTIMLLSVFLIAAMVWEKNEYYRSHWALGKCHCAHAAVAKINIFSSAVFVSIQHSNSNGKDWLWRKGKGHQTYSEIVFSWSSLNVSGTKVWGFIIRTNVIIQWKESTLGCNK